MANTPQSTDSTTLPTPTPAALPDAAPQATLSAVLVPPAKQRATPVKRARAAVQKTATKTAPVPQPAEKPAAVKKAPAKPALAPKTIVKAVAPKMAKPKAEVSKATAPKAATPAKAEKKPVAAKLKKEKLVRDSFTIPKSEFAVLDELKQRAGVLARPVKKSELLRAGIKMLASLSNDALLAALSQVPTIKTGRPALKK